MTCRLLLELDHDDWNSVEEQSEIHAEGLGLVLINELAANREHVLFIERIALGHLVQIALVERKADCGVRRIVLHLLIERGEKTATVYLVAEQLDKAILILTTIGRFELIQFFGLRCLKELEQLCSVKRVCKIVIASLALYVTVREEIVKYLISERVFS